MDRSTTPSRRQFLAAAGVGAAISVAGCNGMGDGGSDGSGGGSGGDGSNRQATLIVQPDQQAIQSAQQNATQGIQSGDVNRSAAVQQFQETRAEIIGDAVANVETEIEDSSVTIEDRQAEQGALLVSGPPGELLDLLDNESVGALVDAATFEELGQQSPMNQTQSG